MGVAPEKKATWLNALRGQLGTLNVSPLHVLALAIGVEAVKVTLIDISATSVSYTSSSVLDVFVGHKG